jgi:hypothetical protein
MYLLGSVWFKGIAPNPVDVLRYRLGGAWVRHPSEGWWSDGDRLSRDQSTPLVIVLSEFFSRRLLRRFFFQHLRRFFFFTNTRRNGATMGNDGEEKYPGRPEWGKHNYSWKVPDFIGFEFLAIYIRAFRAWWFYPLLLIFDLETLISSVLWWYRDRDTDVLNHIIVCNYATRVYPTPISKLAKRLNKYELMKSKMDHYFDRVGLPEMSRLWYSGL